MNRYAWKGPVKAEPDFENLLQVLRRKKPQRPTLFELFLNQPLNLVLAGSETADWETTRPYGQKARIMRAYRNAGYDYVTLHAAPMSFPNARSEKKNTISLNAGFVITDRESFEKYPWPDPDSFDYGVLDVLGKELPGGMKIIPFGPGGVLENVIALTGYDRLCYMLIDDPPLVQDVFDAVGSRLVRYYEICVQHDSAGAIVSNDDWGFKTQTMLAPDDMRTYCIPWHRKIAATAHAAGRPVILHSCGRLESVMDDIIDDIQYDGKHSYEDTIQTVESAYDQYHHRIAIIGGLDVDFVVRSTPDQVYRRARAMLEKSSGEGSFALGTGNSVPQYVPHENYLAMISAATEMR